MPATATIFDRLRAIQDQYGYLPPEQLRALSKSTEIPLFQIHGVADFYPHFHLKPPPKVSVRVCADLSCHLRGAPALRADVDARFGVMKKKDVSVSDVSCLGQCDGAPAASINGHIYRNVGAAQAEALVMAALGGSPLPEILVEPREASFAANPDAPTYGAVRKLMTTRDWDGVISRLKASGLGGMGGAGFPTGVKWEAVRRASSPEKYVICNADESEPGTIKDRFILDHFPHLVVEGMIIAGLVTGARRGIIYIRNEYSAQAKTLEQEILGANHVGLLGSNILASELAFEIEIFVSPGGYICGEETALLEALEGKRAEPRNKPPLPVTQGLWNQPTALNNVETFANVPEILMKGPDGDVRPKFVSVSGDVRRPGVFRIPMGAPMGIPMSEVIFDYAGGVRDGKKLKAFAPSGPSSGFLPASMVDVRVDRTSLAAAGSMLGSSGIVVCAEGACMLDLALNATAFFRNESCGKCVPCRIGTQELVDMLSFWSQGKGTAADLKPCV